MESRYSIVFTECEANTYARVKGPAEDKTKDKRDTILRIVTDLPTLLFKRSLINTHVKMYVATMNNVENNIDKNAYPVNGKVTNIPTDIKKIVLKSHLYMPLLLLFSGNI